jgi:hypothetical protein
VLLSVGVAGCVCEIGIGFSFCEGLEGDTFGDGLVDVGTWAIGCGVLRAVESAGLRVAGCGVLSRELDTGCGVSRVAVCEVGVKRLAVCDVGSIPPPCFFASPGGMQPDDPGVQPHPVFLPWLHPGGVPPFCFQLALPWLKPAGIPVLARRVW